MIRFKVRFNILTHETKFTKHPLALIDDRLQYIIFTHLRLKI